MKETKSNKDYLILLKKGDVIAFDKIYEIYSKLFAYERPINKKTTGKCANTSRKRVINRPVLSRVIKKTNHNKKYEKKY